MKATGLLSLTITCAVLMHGTVHAAQQTTAGRSATATGDHRQDAGHHRDAAERDRYHPRSRASPIAAKHPKPLPNSRKAPVSGQAMNLLRPGPSGSRIALPARLPGVGRNALSTPGMVRSNTVRPNIAGPNIVRPDTVRHRSPNPAVIGGSVPVARRNTGGIDGTRIYRRP